MSFYRTYRPQIIAEIDNVHVREQMMSLLKKDRTELPHAYLLTGPKGAGKTTAARILAKLYNCEHFLKRTGPCGTCGQCTSIANGTNMDVLEIDAASNRGIDEIRELRDRIALSPVGGRYKIYIIDEVHMLTTEAFNALLKTLEEPPKHAVFVLATTDLQKIPATIKSRCISIPFRRATKEELVSVLKKIVKKEKLTIDADAIDLIAKEADGAFRDAVKFLEQLSFSKKTITVDSIVALLSSSGNKELLRFMDALAGMHEQEAFSVIETLTAETKDVRGFIVDVLRMLQEYLTTIGKGGTALGWDRAGVRRAMTCFVDAYGLMKTSPIAEIPLELAVMEFCRGNGPVVHIPTPQPTAASLTVPADKKEARKEEQTPVTEAGNTPHAVDDSFTVEKLTDCWKEVIEALKPYNHSVAGVLRSAHPKEIREGAVIIETPYQFHQERLSEPKVCDILGTVFKKLFGVEVRVEVVLSKKQGG